MQDKLSIRELPLKDQRIILRVDFNVPINASGEITDDTRIKAALPTIQYILEEVHRSNATLIILSHMGRPKGRDPALSLNNVAKRLQELLNHPVKFLSDCIGAEVEREIQNSISKPATSRLFLLENVRFYPEEEKPNFPLTNDSFVAKLAALGTVFINDAFATAHRKHSSTALIAQFFPESSAYGFLVEKEIRYLGTTLLNPAHPFCAIIGGAKISSKLGLLYALIEKVDVLMIGGAMAYTFLKANGIAIGNSLCEDNLIEEAKEIMKRCVERKVKLYLPLDLQVTDRYANDATTRTIHLHDSGIPDGFEGMDIGPETIRIYSGVIANMETIFWNGPLGVAEFSRFAVGTNSIAKALANSPATTIVGGGDSLAAIEQSGVADQISHLSTGGGASLEFIQFGTLPGIEALTSHKKFHSPQIMDSKLCMTH